MQVEGQHGGCSQPLMATGARVSNAYPTFPRQGHNPVKAGLIPRGPHTGHPSWGIGSVRPRTGMRPISLLAG